MKNTSKVKICICFLLSSILTGCHEFTPPTSHYGTGTYRCFYHDVRNGQIYKGAAREEKEAAQNAKNACIKGAKDWDHRYCAYAECIFK